MIFQQGKREHGKINVIPNNSERYILFDVGRLKFLDSMQFLSCGLNKLAEQLSVDQFNSIQLKTAYPVHWKLLSEKGIYCYDYMNSMDRYDETSLPSKEYFFNKLYDKHVYGPLPQYLILGTGDVALNEQIGSNICENVIH